MNLYRSPAAYTPHMFLYSLSIRSCSPTALLEYRQRLIRRVRPSLITSDSLAVTACAFMFAIVPNARESQFSMVGRGASREAWQWLVAKSVSSRMWYVFPRSGGQSEISRMGSCGRRGHKKKGEGGEGEGKGEGVASTAYPIVTPSQTPALFFLELSSPS